MKKLMILLVISGLILSIGMVFAAEVEKIDKTNRQIQEEERLRQKIEKKPKPVEIEEKLPELPALAESAQKVWVKKITVSGITAVAQKEVNAIIAKYENQELTLTDMNKVAGLITDIYRQKGYITSRAYLPPQNITEGLLEIKIVEGVVGDIEIKGNRYFKSALLRNKIALEKGEIFNYDILKRGVSKINESPDRYAKTVIAPGKEAGTTDTILEVKDHLPLHAQLDWNNYASRYINKDRYTCQLSHNNLLGLDDKLIFQYQLSEASRYYLRSMRYILPLPKDLDLDFFVMSSRVKLGEEYEDSDVRGKTKFYSLTVNRPMLDRENLDIKLSLGFDYKDTTNYQLQTVSSHDRLRVLRTGLDIDMIDSYGRSIVSNELDLGLSDLMGGLKKQDSNASRSGSGGKFVKDTISFVRLHNMPKNSQLLWRTQLQLSPYILTSMEQFQIGGISNCRGYPPAEVVGDRGYSTSFEWSFPLYGLDRQIKVPFSSAKLYDALRISFFYDWANARLRRPVNDEQKERTLRSIGWGMRFSLPEDFSLRLDFGWPLDNTPSDSDHLHTWVRATKTF